VFSCIISPFRSNSDLGGMIMQQLLSLALLMGVVFTGCSSLPAKTGNDDCLVVVKCEVVNKSMVPVPLDFWLNFSPKYPSVLAPKYSGYMVILIKEPAVQVVSLDYLPA